MAEFVALRPVRAVYEHPNADKLAVVKVGEFTVVHSLDQAKQFKEGQLVVHFPTDICIDPDKAVELGVDKYCRGVQYKGVGERVNCRIVAARLRGVPSYGFINLDTSIKDEDLDDYYGVCKYEPPEPEECSDTLMSEHQQFPRYTKIKRIQYNPEYWKEGLPVRVTEKIHGRNIRLGIVKQGDEWTFMVGSHSRILKEYNVKGNRVGYWNMLTEPVKQMLTDLCQEKQPIVVYGEMAGPGCQDMDYGFAKPELRVFDLMIDGQYQDWEVVEESCKKYGISTVPLIRTGGFTWSMPSNHTDGGSLVNHPSMIKSKFKGREGVVITPLKEQLNPLGGRLIAKSVSADYESRRGGTDYH